MTGAKSVLKVKKEETFLDLTVRQIEHLNVTNHADVPLILMTSFNTNEDTNRLIKKYANRPPRITTFNQSRYPRICADTKLPCPKHVEDEKKAWYPPGHGDLYDSLLHGCTQSTFERWERVSFRVKFGQLGRSVGTVPQEDVLMLTITMYNSVDQKILQHMIDSQSEFLMEVTDKTKADVEVRSVFHLFDDITIPINGRKERSSTMTDPSSSSTLLKFPVTT